MTSLTEQIDRFVRWFFNSSPDKTSIEPRPRSADAKAPAPRHGRAAGKRRPGQERRAVAMTRVARARP